MNQSDTLKLVSNNEPFLIPEHEVKDIIKGYNTQLKALADENFFVKEELKSLQTELVNLKSQVHKMEKERKKSTLDLEEMTLVINKLKDELSKKDDEIKGFLEAERVPESLESKQTIMQMLDEKNLEEETQKIFEGILTDNENLRKEADSLKYIGKLLKDENVALRKKLEEFETEKLKRKFCIHCKNEYNPLTNENNSCKFHPGKLKFYSCRSCGGDEYYNCCNHCSKCNIGCKEGKHVSME